jgi:hypothetical protein
MCHEDGDAGHTLSVGDEDDRPVSVREIVPPALLALIGLTFVLMMPPILLNAERLIARACPGRSSCASC